MKTSRHGSPDTRFALCSNRNLHRAMIEPIRWPERHRRAPSRASVDAPQATDLLPGSCLPIHSSFDVENDMIRIAPPLILNIGVDRANCSSVRPHAEPRCGSGSVRACPLVGSNRLPPRLIGRCSKRADSGGGQQGRDDESIGSIRRTSRSGRMHGDSCSRPGQGKPSLARRRQAAHR